MRVRHLFSYRYPHAPYLFTIMFNRETYNHHLNDEVEWEKYTKNTLKFTHSILDTL